MTDKRLRKLPLTLDHDQYEDLTNALEDYRDGFRAYEQEAIVGLGLDAKYWHSRAVEVQELLDTVRDLATTHRPYEGDTSPEP